VLPLAAACGGEASGGGHPSATDVAKSAGCDAPSTMAPGDQEMFVTNTVTCTYKGHDMTIGWFKSHDPMKNYRKFADQMGGGGIGYGDDFVVQCPDDQSDCDAIVKAAKG
jgi:hypothetical protein